MASRSLHDRLDGLTVAYTRQLVRWRWLVLVISLVAAGLLGKGAPRIRFENDYRYFFSKENPQIQDFLAMQAIYSKNDNLLIAVVPDSGNVWTNRSLEVVARITRRAWKLPLATRVDSVTNFQHTRAVEDDLVVNDLVEDPAALTGAQLREIRRIAVAEPLLRNRLVVEGNHITAVSVTFELPDRETDETTRITQAARELIAEVRKDYPDFEFYVTGLVPLNNAFNEAMVADLQTLVPAMYLVIVILFAVLLRSIFSTLGGVLVIVSSCMAGMGVMGWLNIPMTPPSSTAPTMITTLAVADSIHILVTFLHLMRHRGFGKHDAIVESMRLNVQPVFITSLTTAIGFLSMNFSDAPPFRDLGNVVAMGVMLAFFFSVTLLPAVMAVFPVRVKPREESAHSAMERLANAVIGARRPLLWGGVLLSAGLAACIPRNEFNDAFVRYFDQRIEFRRHSDFIMDNLTGMYLVEYSLEAEDSGGISEGRYLEVLEEFSAWWRTQSEVIHVNTFSDVMKRLNRSMHGDEEKQYRLPENREMAAQFLLLYEMSLPYGLDLNNQMNVDKSSTRMVITLRDITSNEIREVAERGEQWLRDHAPEHMAALGVGPTVMFSHIASRNIRSMLGGTTLALVLISLMLIVALRSVKIGLISLFPNLAPAAMAFGLWGLVVGEVGMSLAVVTAMSLGIVVDDTVHFLSKYLRARREQGLDAPNAVRYAFASVGPALVVTSVILFCGFMVLSFSAFYLNSGMGRLTAMVILIALAADFFILPALVMMIDGKEKI